MSMTAMNLFMRRIGVGVSATLETPSFLHESPLTGGQGCGRESEQFATLEVSKRRSPPARHFRRCDSQGHGNPD